MTGGFAPSPMKFGSSKNSVNEIFLNALNQADGNALTDDVDSFVYAENFAIARALTDIWSSNARMAYQWDPHRMTDFVPRWEKILGIFPLQSDTMTDRRNRIAGKLATFGKSPNRNNLDGLLTLIFADVYLGIVNTPSTDAIGSVPGGITVPGGVTLPDGDWTSTIAHIAIATQQPTSIKDADYYATKNEMVGFLNDFLPAWTTFAIFKDGPSGAGFFLDDPKNLDNERFR